MSNRAYRADKDRAYRAKNKTRVKAKIKEWRDKNPEKFKAMMARAARKSHLKRKYGITIEQYNGLLEQQGNKCAICYAETNGALAMCVDHNHVTNKVRGLLCDACNRLVGIYESSGHTFQKIRAYLGAKDAVGAGVEVYVPYTLNSIRPDLQRFWDAMVYKLNKNSHKGRWDRANLGSTLERLREEVIELTVAIKEGSSSEILMEGADVANFALIAANIALEAKGV